MTNSNNNSILCCPVCNNKNISSEFCLYDDRYGYPGEFTLFACSVCNHRFIVFDLNAGNISDLYTNYYPRKQFDIKNHQPHKKVSAFRTWLDGLESHAYRWVPENVTVLDIGCGTCNSIGFYQNRGCNAYGIDTDRNVSVIAKEFGYKVKIGEFDASSFRGIKFDYITLDQVIEHIQDPDQTISDIFELLKPGGKLIISTPNSAGWGVRIFGKKWINWHVPYHVNYYTRNSLRTVCEKKGLNLVKSITVTPSDWLYYQACHLLAYPPQGENSLFWSNNEQFYVDMSVLKKLCRLLHRVKILHLMTRFFDALNLGDNQLHIYTRS